MGVLTEDEMRNVVKWSVVKLLCFLWLGAPGPKGEKGMPGVNEEGIQGPRGRTGKCNLSALTPRSHWSSLAARFRASSALGPLWWNWSTFPPQHPGWFLSAKTRDCSRQPPSFGSHSYVTMYFKDLKHIQGVLLLLPLCIQEQMFKG